MDKFFTACIVVVALFFLGMTAQTFIAWEVSVPLATTGSRLWLVFCILYVAYRWDDVK